MKRHLWPPEHRELFLSQPAWKRTFGPFHLAFFFFLSNLIIIILKFSPANRPPCHEFAASPMTETHSGSAGEKTRLPMLCFPATTLVARLNTVELEESGGQGDSVGDSDWVIPWD